MNTLLGAIAMSALIHTMGISAQTGPDRHLTLNPTMQHLAQTPLMSAARRFESGPTPEKTVGRSTRQASSAQTGSGRGWISRHPALFGALLGAATGTIAAGTMDNEWFCSGSDDDCVMFGGGRFAAGATIGAGVGALVGWITSLGRD